MRVMTEGAQYKGWMHLDVGELPQPPSLVVDESGKLYQLVEGLIYEQVFPWKGRFEPVELKVEPSS